MQNSKLELVKQASTGDRGAIEKLIKIEQKNIYSMLFYLKKDDNEISDIMQDILIKLSSKITKLKNPLSFKVWLNHIIVNSYYDYLRKSKKATKIVSLNISDENEKEILEIPDNTLNPQISILSEEMDSIIKNSIQNLPQHYKIPLTLREIQGLSYDEISNITKTSLGTVKSRISRARTLIQTEINKYAKNEQ